jgi:hypothetical protein
VGDPATGDRLGIARSLGRAHLGFASFVLVVPALIHVVDPASRAAWRCPAPATCATSQRFDRPPRRI